MLLTAKKTYSKNEVISWPFPNHWDLIAAIFVLAVIILLGYGANAMIGKFDIGNPIAISLDPRILPYYTLRTVLRMGIAMFFSLLFTFIFGTWAAKSRQAERIIIPILDVLQSVPVLGFLTITVMNFIAFFHGNMLGPESAAIFAIFTAQVWNMTFSFYQSLRTVPPDLLEVASIFQLSSWQQFWRVEVPFSMPGLLWNSMMSMSGSWIFLTVSEAISVANHNISLPGIGSYTALAIEHANKMALIYVIITMFIVIALYDQLLFRPLVTWAEKFEVEVSVGGAEPQSWILSLFQRARFLRFIGYYVGLGSNAIINWRIFHHFCSRKSVELNYRLRQCLMIGWNVLLGFGIAAAIFLLSEFILAEVRWDEILHVFYFGLVTGFRVMILIIVSSIIWVPIGVWVGLRPNVSRIVQPIAQFLAAFPANLLFPLVVMIIIRYRLNINIWTSPLMIFGAQWYILFNVVAGTMAVPKKFTLCS